MRHNLAERAKAILVQTRTTTSATTANTTGQDMREFETAVFLLTFDNIAAGASVSEAKLQESTDNSTWSDITGANFRAQQSIGDTDDNKIIVGEVNLRSRKQYIRFTITTLVGAVSWGMIALASGQNVPPGQTQTIAFQV